jgi:UDP:flavonoid glycosyltransferase YjiC (YdhE family)
VGRVLFSSQSTSPLKDTRILAIPSAVGLAHLTRLALIARELAPVGAEVAFAYRDSQNGILKQLGFSVLPVADAVVTDFTSNVYAAYTPPLIEQCIQDELAVIDAFRPDLVLGDFRLTASISTRVAQVPFVSVVDGCMTSYFNPVAVMLSEEDEPARFQRATFITRVIQNRQKKSLARHFREAARRHRVRRLKSLYDFLEGDLTLVADLPDFNPLFNLPGHFLYTGPLIWEGLDPQPYPLPDIDSDRTLIYATVGNTGQAEFIDLVTQAFGDDDAYQVILTTGAFIDPAVVPSTDNIHAARFIPGSQVIPKARAVIHCGGSGSLYQALLCGAPTLVIPFAAYQRINAWLTKKNHVGIPLSPVQLTPQRVKESLRQLVADEEIKTNVQRFQESWKKDSGPKVAALRIARFWAGINGQGSEKGGQHD